VSDFVAEFAASITAQSQAIRSLFSQEPGDPVEERLAVAMANHWHPLPLLTNDERQKAYAVDGSGAIRFFENGACMIVSHALLERAGREETATDVIFRRANVPNPLLDRYRDLSLRRMEIKLALDHLDDLVDGILYLDGSLYAELPHLLYPLDIRDAAELPLRILAMYLELWQRCRELGVVVVGISKTSRGRLLGNTFLNLLADSDTIPACISDAEMVSGSEGVATDAEILYRWTEGAGFSTPILVGMQSFGHRRRQLLSDPAALVEEYEQRGVDADWASAILDNVLAAPAIAACYVRFSPGEDPLRVEVPATVVLDEPLAMVDFYSRIIAPDSIYQVLAYLLASYGGLSVYNAPLYTADRKVRLNRRVVDGKYLSIVRQVVGKPVNYDRSLRRFARRSYG
jgi:ligand-binding sensor protein